MTDILLQKFFEKARWEKAINTGWCKGIDKAELKVLTTPEVRAIMCQYLETGEYRIAPPHIALIPKGNGEMREVMICENMDRILLSIGNDLFFEMFPDMIHPSCKSYQTGIGCGKVVQEMSRVCAMQKGPYIGKKYDLKKYFDSVKIEHIDEVFDAIERRVCKSVITDTVREFYHSNWLFDAEGNLVEIYKSIKQGTATSSFLANALLYRVDEQMSTLPGINYWRYSDDILIIGENYEMADEVLKGILGEMALCINPKKEQLLDDKHFFKFLGFNIKGSQITLSKTRIKDFQKEIESRTIKKRNITKKKAVNNVNRFLYIGDGQYSWATSILPIVNVEKDIDELNEFVMDCIRACETGKKKVGGLGVVLDKEDYTILRGIGKNVRANKQKTEKEIEGYYSLQCMQNAIRTRRPAYEAIVRTL